MTKFTVRRGYLLTTKALFRMSTIGPECRYILYSIHRCPNNCKSFLLKFFSRNWPGLDVTFDPSQEKPQYPAQERLPIPIGKSISPGLIN